MRAYELTEAFTPDNKFTIYLNREDDSDEFAVFGGRVLEPKNFKTFFKLNLKNVKVPRIRTEAVDKSNKPALLFHGTLAEFDQFEPGNIWLSAEPYTPLFHASFHSYGQGGQMIYACILEVRNLFVMGDKINGKIIELPVAGSDNDLDIIYDNGYDSIVWYNKSDTSIGPITNIYHTKDPKNVHILQKFKFEEIKLTPREMSKKREEFNISKPYKFSEPEKDTEPKIYIVTEPGLTPFRLDDRISQTEYDEYKDYGLEVKKYESI